MTGRMKTALKERWTAPQGLTHSLDYGKEGLAVNATRICSLDGCDRKAYRAHLCIGHYARRAKNGAEFDRSPIRVPIEGCSEPGCARPHYGRGLCQMHYGRARRRDMNPDAIRYHKGTYFERLFDRIDATAPCWEWLGYTTAKGYGVMKYEGKNRYVHNRVWEFLVGPVPDGLELDHLCKNRKCCNPDHLEPVTHAENTRRSGFASAAEAARVRSRAK